MILHQKHIYSLLLFFLLSAWLFFSGTPAAEDKYTLLIAEHDPEEPVNYRQHLYAYFFSGGNFYGKEKILTVLTKKEEIKGSYIRFDLGRSALYKNRYIITGTGSVIDTQSKKILLDKKYWHLSFVKGSGDSLIFYTDDIFHGKYYSILDLKTGKYEVVRDVLFKVLPGRDIGTDNSLGKYCFWLYPVNKPKQLLINDAGYGENPELRDRKRATLPFVWTDDDHFIYPNYSLQGNSCVIYKVNVNRKKQTKLGEIDSIPPLRYNSFFMKDADGNLVYVCGRGKFLIDAENKKLTRLIFESLGSGFSAAVNETASKGRSIRYHDTGITSLFFDCMKVRSCEGYIAVPYELVIENERYPKGVKVWNNITGKWKDIPMENELAEVVGWIKE